LVHFFSAQKFGIKQILPAYLDPNIQLQDLLTGVSFASGGAGYDPLTAKIMVVNNYFDNFNYIHHLFLFNCRFRKEIFILFISHFQSSR
jgi:hypothetical protein